jgi:hypothetical protein
MLENVSPDCTVWVRSVVLGDGTAAAAAAEAGALVPGTLSFWPGTMTEVIFRPLDLASFSGLVPALRAIFSRLSPALTV